MKARAAYAAVNIVLSSFVVFSLSFSIFSAAYAAVNLCLRFVLLTFVMFQSAAGAVPGQKRPGAPAEAGAPGNLLRLVRQ